MSNPESKRLQLEDGQRVAVIGGGPAGSFFANFLLVFAERVGLEIGVDIYESRDFTALGPAGCNMCGGIVSESLVQNLALEGIDLPEAVVQRGIDAYMMHTEAGTCPIETPSREKRIAAVHRGGGPRTARLSRWQSFDNHLLNLAVSRGATVRRARVTDIQWKDGRPEVRAGKESPETYDLLIGAIGVNSGELKLFENLGFGYQRPTSVRTFITEIEFGAEKVKELFGSAMHVFLLNLPRLDFSAIIPKGDYVTLCMLGTDIDKDLIDAFWKHPVVKSCFPPGWEPPKDACRCLPKMHFGAAKEPFADRVALIGDCAVARLFKDGIGAAFRTSRAAARAAVFEGVSAEAFKTGYLPECRNITRDNIYGKVVFSVVHLIKHISVAGEGVLRAVISENGKAAVKRRMSLVLWDVFTGSASYRDIFLRTLNPAFLTPLILAVIKTVLRIPYKKPGSPEATARSA